MVCGGGCRKFQIERHEVVELVQRVTGSHDPRSRRSRRPSRGRRSVLIDVGLGSVDVDAGRDPRAVCSVPRLLSNPALKPSGLLYIDAGLVGSEALRCLHGSHPHLRERYSRSHGDGPVDVETGDRNRRGARSPGGSHRRRRFCRGMRSSLMAAATPDGGGGRLALVVSSWIGPLGASVGVHERRDVGSV